VVSTQPTSLTIAWAIAQYRQALASVGLGKNAASRVVKTPSESPEIVRYLRAIGIGRNVDAYA
jgi:hypothetical protein